MSIDYQNLFERLACGVFTCNADGSLRSANLALLKMLGYQDMADYQTKNRRPEILLKPEIKANIKKAIEHDGCAVECETILINQEGISISAAITCHATYDDQGACLGYEGIVVDCSRQKKKEKALREAHDFLKNKVLGYEGIIIDQYQQQQIEKELKKAYDLLKKILQSSPNLVLVTDLYGKIIIMNRAAEKTLGYRAEDIVGKLSIEAMYPDGVAAKIMERLRSPYYGSPGRLVSYPIVNRRCDGSVVEGNLAAAVLYDDNDNEIGCVHITIDLTERLAMERKLRMTQRQLMQSEKLAAMGRLTSQIAHELNNPIYGIMNTLELLKTEISSTNRKRKLLDMALSETVRLGELLHKMLSFSKPDQLEKRPVDINAILDETLLLHEKHLQERNISISMDLDSGVDLVYASKDQMRQVFLNLIANARDALSSGGTVRVTTRNNSGFVRIEMADDGTGIEPEVLDKVFDAFYTTKDSVKGVGLGLSVCYGIIKEHEGDIQIESNLGTGTTVMITLPAYRPPRKSDRPK